MQQLTWPYREALPPPIMSRRYALRFYAFDHSQRIEPLPMKAGQVRLTPDQPDLHIWAEPVRRLRKAKENGGWPENLDWPTDNQPPSGEAQESVIVLFVPTAALSSGLFFQELISGSETGLRRIEPLPGQQQPVAVLRRPTKSAAQNSSHPRDYCPSPIITVSLENAMALYEESAGLDCDPPNTTTWKEQRETNRRLYSLGLDHRVKFLDSSIWHRYVAYDEGFEKNLLARLCDVAVYSDLRLYRSLASLASLEFQCRMLLNSFIVPLGANGHHDAVTPFKFHSETWMARQSERILQFFRQEGDGMQLIDLQWNSLIVDDHADESISTIDDDSKRLASLPKSGEQPPTLNERPPTKRNLIARWLHQDAVETAGKMLNVQTENCTTGEGDIIAQGIKILREQTCDVIFLDYLLGKGETPRANGREYGHEFLLEIATGQQLPHRGPLGRYWIFPISSFPFAFTDKLRQLGMEGVSDRWYISEGGDPIATPEMFRFNFLRMALLQISECYLYPAAMVRLLERFSGMENLKEWGEAVRMALDFREVALKLLATDHSQNSEFARSMTAFLQKQSRYNQQITRLKDLIALLEKDMDVVQYQKIDESLLNLMGNIHSHPIVGVVERKLTKRDEVYWQAVDKISKEARKGSRKLDLKGLGLLGLPTMISEHSQLEHLNLANNHIIILPTGIGGLTQLVRLDLAGNDFPKIPSVLQNLPALTWLDLSRNPRLGDLAKVYKSPEEIKWLMNKAVERKMLHDSGAQPAPPAQ